MTTAASDLGLDTERTQPGRPGRIRSLDGLRAVAVLAVMLFHTASAPLAGGYLGVDLFFVLSGFLIAGILLDESRTSGGISLGDFWLRRARRLAPALLVLLVAISVARIAVPHADAGTWRPEILAALTYTTNWYQIASGSDYFAQFALQSPLLHTWSLAIEEQFYLAFAVLMVLLCTRLTRRRLMQVLIVLALVSAGWMALRAGSDPAWAYYSTGTRVQALLVGAVLAIAVRSPLSSGDIHSRARRTAGWVSGSAILVALAAPIPNAVMLRGGFLIVAVLASVLIWALLGSGVLTTVLSWRPLVALGVISYGVYLWHWPIFLMLGTDREGSLAMQFWAIVLTVAVASLSYVLVEKPLRIGRFTEWPAHRQWGVYAIAAAVVAASTLLPARTPASDSQITWPQASEVPQRIMVGGDSTVLALWKHFPHDEYPDAVVDGPLSLGCGIVDVPYVRQAVVQDPEKCKNWRDVWRQKVAEMSPDVAVIGSTVWDSFDRSIAGATYAPGTAEFDRAFLDGFRQAIDIAGSSGRIPVYVMGQPCMAGEVDEILNDPQRSAKIDALIRSEVSAMPNTHFIDTRAFTCTSDGTAVDAAGAEPLREDGVHWGQHGADVFWSTALSQIVADRGGTTGE
ncbi:MAG: acyltransferase family protein [Candidatus Nanopelagicales bacterium]